MAGSIGLSLAVGLLGCTPTSPLGPNFPRPGRWPCGRCADAAAYSAAVSEVGAINPAGRPGLAITRVTLAPGMTASAEDMSCRHRIGDPFAALAVGSGAGRAADANDGPGPPWLASCAPALSGQVPGNVWHNDQPATLPGIHDNLPSVSSVMPGRLEAECLNGFGQ